MEMNSPVGSNALDVGADGIVGKPLDRVDGRLKVTGGARYAYEMQQGKNTLYGFVVEASIGKGTIKSIDTRAAEVTSPIERMEARFCKIGRISDVVKPSRCHEIIR